MRRKTFEGLQPSPEVADADEGRRVGFDLALVVMVEAFDVRLPDRAIPLSGNGLSANRESDAFDPAIRPSVSDPGGPVVETGFVARMV